MKKIYKKPIAEIINVKGDVQMAALSKAKTDGFPGTEDPEIEDESGSGETINPEAKSSGAKRNIWGGVRSFNAWED